MKEELTLNVERIASTPEDYDALREAISKLAAASEEQFQEIKNEKWYQRVFDMITFSKKNEKRLAEQISTLAQAQQILIELLLRLAENDVNISQLVLENTNDIRRISEQTIYLLDRINKLENVALGIHADTDIRGLSDKGKQVLSALLYQVGGKKPSNEAQADFVNAVFSYLGMEDVQMDNPFKALEGFDNDLATKRKLLACCMEYIFLSKCTDDAYADYEDFLDEFDFGRKTVDSIKKQIVSIYQFRGAKGLYEKYSPQSFAMLNGNFYVEFEDDEEEIEFEIEEESETSPVIDNKWYPIFEEKIIETGIMHTKKHLTEIFLAMKEDSDIRKTITLNAVSGKACGNYICYVTKDEHNVTLHVYCISEKTETEIKRTIKENDYISTYSILACTEKWVVCLMEYSPDFEIGKDLALLDIFNVQMGTVYEMMLKTDGWSSEVCSLVVVDDYFFLTQGKKIYKGDMNARKMAELNSIEITNIHKWSGQLHVDGKYLFGFWLDGNYYHYVKFDTESNMIVETCKIEYNELMFTYGSAYSNNKMYCLGFYSQSRFHNDKVKLKCFDLKTHEISLVAEYDTTIGHHPYMSHEIKAFLQVENRKIRCEVVFEPRYSFDQRKQIKEYF